MLVSHGTLASVRRTVVKNELIDSNTDDTVSAEEEILTASPGI